MMAMTPLAQAMLTIAMLGVVALLIGGRALVRRGGAERTRGYLMFVVAAVLFGNVLIWAWP